MKVKVKREITAFEYAVVEIVCALDRLFRFSTYPFVTGGLDIEYAVTMQTTQSVRIIPNGWTEGNRIFLRFHKDVGEWKAFEGNIIARHLPQEFSRFAFECHWDLNGYYRFRGKGTDDEILFKRLLTDRGVTEMKQD